MQRWPQIGLSFVLGGVIGFTISEQNSDDAHLSALTDRIAVLEARVPTEDAKARVPRAPSAVVSGRAQPSLDGAPVRGPADAPVTIVEFSDFQCAFCSRVHPTLLRLLEAYPDTIRLVFKHNPLSVHKDAALAHRASLAAERQGRFWEMHDLIFGGHRDLSRGTLIEYARELELEVALFTRDLDSTELVARLDRDLAEAERLGVTGMPTFFINGRVVHGAQPYENFKALIEREAARVGS